MTTQPGATTHPGQPAGSYAARVLVVPLGPSGWQMLAAARELGTGGVMALRTREVAADDAEAELEPVGDTGWSSATGSRGPLAQLAASADMLVFLAHALDEVPTDLVRVAADAVRRQGGLVAATIVGIERWRSPAGQAAMVALREAVDMLVEVRQVSLAASFIDVLRGGTRGTSQA